MEYLDDFYNVYLNNILIFSKTKKEYKIYVKRILARLQECKLQADIDKCEFHVTCTKYLGFIINTDKIAVNSEKIRVIIK